MHSESRNAKIFAPDGAFVQKTFKFQFLWGLRAEKMSFLMCEFADVVNCINLIFSCDTTKLKNFSTPHLQILDPPLESVMVLHRDMSGSVARAWIVERPREFQVRSRVFCVLPPSLRLKKTRGMMLRC